MVEVDIRAVIIMVASLEAVMVEGFGEVEMVAEEVAVEEVVMVGEAGVDVKMKKCAGNFK
jgi:hypothetical protein